MSGKKASRQQVIKNTPTKKIGYKDQLSLNQVLIILGGILTLTFIIYFKITDYGFINMDDDLSIARNARVRDLSLNGWTGHFTHFNMGMYAPVTETSYSIIYALGGMKPGAYHFASIILHMLTAIAVFLFVNKLSGDNLKALIVAGLFSLHPIGVESVAWAAGFSNILFSFFYLLSLYAYLRYTDDIGKKKWYIIAFVLFIVSVLSKSAAITLPVILVLLDFYRDKGLNIGKLAEKVPFFIISIVFGIMTILSRNASGENVSLEASSYSLTDRFLMVPETVWFYIGKILLPFNLSFFYPFDHSNGWVWYFYAAPVLTVIALAGIWLKSGSLRKDLIMGFGFFLVVVSIMLPFVKTGTSEMRNDRYIYLAGVGILYLIGWLSSGLYRQKWPQWVSLKQVGLFIPAIFAIFFAVQLHSRTKIWENNITLYSNVIEQFPNDENARNNRGTEYKTAGKYQQAIEDFNITIATNPRSSSGYMNRGNCYADLGDYNKALADYNKALEFDKKSAIIWYNRGIAYNKTGQHELAVSDYTTALKLKSNYPEALYNRAIAYNATGDTENAIADYNAAITQKPDYKEAYHNRGIIFAIKKDLDRAKQDFSKALAIDPAYVEAHISAGNLYAELKQYNQAIESYSTAIQLKPDQIQAFMNRASIYIEMKDYPKAISDLRSAQQLGANVADLIRQLGG